MHCKFGQAWNKMHEARAFFAVGLPVWLVLITSLLWYIDIFFPLHFYCMYVQICPSPAWNLFFFAYFLFCFSFSDTYYLFCLPAGCGQKDRFSTLWTHVLPEVHLTMDECTGLALPVIPLVKGPQIQSHGIGRSLDTGRDFRIIILLRSISLFEIRCWIL